jgi:phosphoserine aminotransferase
LKKIYNFSAGPACLPQQAITSSIESIKNFKQSGMSLLEMSHRSVQVVDLFEETTNNIIELLNIPKNYSVPLASGRCIITILDGSYESFT